MFILKKDQFREFEKIEPYSFNKYMVAHLQEHFPIHCLFHNNESLQAFVDFGYKRAESYGMTTRYEACLFIDIMVMLGSGFDNDPIVAWCKEMLTSSHHTEEKIGDLYDGVLEYLDYIGPENETFPLRAVKNLLEFSISELPLSQEYVSHTDALLAMENIWMEKYLVLEPKYAEKFINECMHHATQYGITDNTGIIYFIVYCFIFGHNCHSDSLYPFIHRSLTDPDNFESINKFNAMNNILCDKLSSLSD